MTSPLRVIVLGLGDVGSAVAHRLFCDGMAVAINDQAMPTTTRRRMAFADAAFDGQARLAGIEARRVADLDGVRRLLGTRRAVPVYLGERDRLKALLQSMDPHVLVEARMRKHAPPEIVRGLVPITVGLGPGFEAGRVCDIAVETSWEQLGAVIYEGTPLDLAGEPRSLGGRAREQYVYAPVDGVFRTQSRIGDSVEAGQGIAMIGHMALSAPIAGVLRGLTRDGVPITIRTKVVEIDPRGDTRKSKGSVSCRRCCGRDCLGSGSASARLSACVGRRRFCGRTVSTRQGRCLFTAMTPRMSARRRPNA